ncbi:cytochrome-c oxidase [Syntrophotalea acetylenivorans]|uniref:Cytochrome-c oxidase n=1 Tax=Syntrophotalea acetylenivorans TaxID=1842532 RepID=A0A1L3GS23_9BACT|nr:cytochrome C oxidase subunit IV family protein [Syntrophotalea acetylenivorans]APG28721.1 cytochrome-c oxidase [Syntrophotalea acetylenivorans]
MNQTAHQPLSFRCLTTVWFLLLILTGITVGVARYDLGAINVWAALGIASLKASLVVFYFMHLKSEPRMLVLCLFVALLTLATFIGLTFFDVLYR